jgi:hypothetical protein
MMMYGGASESWKGSLISSRQKWAQESRDEDGNHVQVASSTAAAAEETMVKWRGNFVPEGRAKALKHVFDDLQDHFGHQRPDPQVHFKLGRGLRHVHGSWCDNVAFTYLINGDACDLEYVGMDVCIDLSEKRVLSKYGGSPFENYGKSWVYVYVPELTIEKVKSYVKAGTGWDVSDERLAIDPNRNLVAIEAKMHQDPQPEPSFWVATVRDKTQMESFSRAGSVQQMFEQPSQQHVHRGIGIFAVSIEVPGYPDAKPNPGMGEEATLSFTLVSVRTWGVTDCIAPIVHFPRK